MFVDKVLPLNNFNPRSPHGERPDVVARRKQSQKFQSTLPARGATSLTIQTARPDAISIHAPRTGSDCRGLFIGMRTQDISIHAPRTGSDPLETFAGAKGFHFNPRSPHGERRARAYFQTLSA